MKDEGRTYIADLREILQEFAQLAFNGEKIYSNIAKVVSVDQAEKTCSVDVINGPNIEDVRLQQLSDDNGFLVVPSIGSLVIISWTDKTTAFVSMFSQIDSIIYQGGANGGLAITPTLVENLNKNNDILTALLNILTGAPIPEPGNGSPSALQAALGASLAGLSVGDFSAIENDKFLH